jgi:hypothetical protein
MNPKRQLGLVFISPLFLSLPPDITSNLHTLILLNAYSLNTIQGFGEIHTLTLSGEYNIKDFHCLGTVRHLDLSGSMAIRTCESLGSVYHVTLSGCPNLEDISALGNNYHVDLSGCRLVQEVNYLKNIQNYLNLSDCSKVSTRKHSRVNPQELSFHSNSLLSDK